MFDFFDRFYKSTDFMPHGDCLVWDPVLLWEHVGSDIATGLAYYLIASILFYFIFKRRDLPFFWVFLLFGAFILSCGTTHFMAAWTVFYPSYWTEGVIKTINAVISLGTAAILVPLMPRLLALPSLQNALDKVALLNRTLHQKVIGLEEEIAKRQAAEKELGERTNFLDKIIESSALSMWISDEQGTAIRANAACLNFFGATEAEVTGKYNLFQDAVIERNGFMPVIRAVFEKGETADIVIDYDFGAIGHIAVKNPTHKIVKSVFTPVLDSAGKVSNVIVQSIDLTDIKRAEREKESMEEQLRQSHKMEAVGTMAGGIAHDFNNILAIILGNAEMAVDDLPPGNPARHNLEEVLAASQRAKNLVRQILAFSRKDKKELIPLRPQSLIKETLKLLRSTTPATISIIQEISGDCGVLMADPTQLHQLVMNLFTNAVHAMDEKGEVTVSLQEVLLSRDDLSQQPMQAPGPYLKLAVTDSGTGMDKETIARIFDPFYTTKEIGQGTGMGLSVVHGIAENHGGFITVESEVGRGSTFTVFFPVTEEEEFFEVETKTPIQTGTERILVVDDEESLLKMAQRMLESLGYTVLTESSSVKALETFKTRADQFDLIITDQSMPELSGSELVAEMLRIRPETRVILCTGYSAKVSEDNAREKGIRKYLNKPYDKKTLSTAVREVLDEKA